MVMTPMKSRWSVGSFGSITKKRFLTRVAIKKHLSREVLLRYDFQFRLLRCNAHIMQITCAITFIRSFSLLISFDRFSCHVTLHTCICRVTCAVQREWRWMYALIFDICGFVFCFRGKSRALDAKKTIRA